MRTDNIDLTDVVLDDDILTAMKKIQNGYGEDLIEELDRLILFLLEHHSTGSEEEMQETMWKLSALAQHKRLIRQLIPKGKTTE